jgi:hypothetical protein
MEKESKGLTQKQETTINLESPLFKLNTSHLRVGIAVIQVVAAAIRHAHRTNYLLSDGRK